MKRLYVELSVIALFCATIAFSQPTECKECEVTIEEVHGVVGNKCGPNEVMVGSEPHDGFNLVLCGKVVCHCCHPH